MLEQLEHIKNWALQDVSTFTARFVADCVVRMCDDAIREARAAEHRNEADEEQGEAFHTEDDTVHVGRIQDDRRIWL